MTCRVSESASTLLPASFRALAHAPGTDKTSPHRVLLLQGRGSRFHEVGCSDGVRAETTEVRCPEVSGHGPK